MINTGAKRSALLPLFFIVLMSWGSPARSATWVLTDRDSWMGAEGIALGGALVAQGNRADFIYANPAAPAFEEKYTLGFSYGTAGDELHAQIIDTKSSKLGGGISFAQRKIENIGRYADSAMGNFDRSEHSALVSLMTKVTDTFAVGISVQNRYLHPVHAPLPSATIWNGDIGVLVKISPEWTLGLAGLDLVSDAKGYTYRTLSAGVSGHVLEGLTLMGQLDFVKAPEGSLSTGFVNGDGSTSLALAADYAVTKEFRVRGSFRSLPSWNQKYVGLGAGYRHETFSIDYGVKFSPSNSKAQYHALALSVDI